ncbi:hypothetical protein HPB50_010815 [Hyalomma asiaticum]|uniref:Uncharacterized protein n=1 Tax=Hyalomma asiaticum TaxID=266040 RepID=A0ACB7SL08_HYAAI|nr:hypothetical protein HPB50_010815 [Hyalomma asiaticum]
MAEPRRIKLETAAHQVPAKQKRAEVCPTRRFQLSLSGQEADSCPEYSYSDLLKSSQPPDADKDDPFGDNDDDNVREIARKFEEKYGSKHGKKRRKGRVAWEDYVDRGMGYDETDPFIDNGEAYDELVPSTLTTKHGGFYINTGELDFRTLSDSDSEDFQGETQPRQVKRGPREGGARRGPKPRGPRPKHLREALATANSGIAEAIESVVRGGGATVVEEEVASSSSSSGGESTGDDPVGPISANFTCPRLPDNLPVELENEVRRLKRAAALRSTEGKCKFFRGHVNQLLLSVELRARELGPGQRQLVYAHLANFLPCTKETLLKRAKKLRLDQEDGRLGEPLRRLKEALDAGESLGDSRLREALCEVVRIKLRCYELSKIRTQSAEEYLRRFLDTEVCPLWPANSPVTAKTLFRESRQIHGHLTSKPRKPSHLPGAALRKMSSHIDTGRESPGTPSMPLTISSSPSASAAPTSSASTPTPVSTPLSTTPAPPPPSSTPSPAPTPPVVSSPAPTATSVPTSVILQSPGRPPSADPRPPRSSPPKPFLASQMLDRIITASLGNFPSSGNEVSVPTTSSRHQESSNIKLEPGTCPPKVQQPQLPRTVTSSASLRLTPSYGFMEAFKRTLEQGEPPSSAGGPPYYKPDLLEGMKGFPYPVGYLPRTSAPALPPERPRPHLSVAQQPQPQHWRQRPSYPSPSASYPPQSRPYPFPSQSHHGSKGASQGQGHVS